MPKCPICKEELTKKTEKGWVCECGEEIPEQYLDSSHHSCGCGCTPLKDVK